MVRLEFLPLRLVRVGYNNRVYINQPVSPGGRDHLLLSRRNHTVKVFNLILKDLDKFHQPSITDVEGPVEFQDTRVPLRV